MSEAARLMFWPMVAGLLVAGYLRSHNVEP